MKLIDKFSKAECEKYIKFHNINLKVECTKIAEDFAIGFYDYCETIRGRLNDSEITIYEAMEIYKKEKGL